MTKTDFVAIQIAIKDARGALTYGLQGCEPYDSAHRIIDSMAKDIAKVLAQQNPKFKRTEFLKGCGVTS